MYADRCGEAVDRVKRHAAVAAQPLADLRAGHAGESSGLGLTKLFDRRAQGRAELVLKVTHRRCFLRGMRTPWSGGLAGSGA